jgi:hypothetical protein
MLMPLEKWAATRLDALGVDGVFAPYIVGMLHDSGQDGDDAEDVKFNVHQVLMGWLSPEDEVHAMWKFTSPFFACMAAVYVCLMLKGQAPLHDANDALCVCVRTRRRS